MKIGTRSILFGVHQCVLHPLLVARAWRTLYGRWPNRYEWAAIVMHDLGYWGLPNMDGPEGRLHPAKSEALFFRLAKKLGLNWRWGFRCRPMIRYHSREMCKLDGVPWPSKLCWPDKYSIVYEWRWLYLLRAWLTGELAEFRQHAIEGGHLPPTATSVDWFNWYRGHIEHVSQIQNLIQLQHQT